MDRIIRSSANVPRDHIVQINMTLVQLDRMFDFVDDAIKNLSLKELACVYFMMLQIIDDSPDIDNRTTIGLDALAE